MAEIQVYRKLWHMSAVWVPLLYWHLVPRDWALPLIFAGLVLALIVDAVRLKSGAVNNWFFKYLRVLIRESERKNLNTATYFIFACFLCILFFEKRVAVTAMLFLSLGDPVAAFIGSKYGSIRFFDKSLQGSLACFFTCFFAAQWIMPVPVAFWAALSATVFELLSSKINDNISIPVFSGLTMTLLLRSGPATGAAGYAVIAFEVYLYFVIATSLTGTVLRHYLVWRCFNDSNGPEESPSPEIAGSGVSVIIFSGNDPALFRRALPYFGCQRYGGDYEIIGVSYGRTDEGAPDSGSETFEPVETWDCKDSAGIFRPSRITLVKTPPPADFPGRLPAWRAAVQHASHDILLFADADAEPDSGYITRMIAPLSREETGLTAAVPVYRGAMDTGAALSSLVVMFLVSAYYYPAAFWDKLRTATGAGLALRRDLLDEIGGLDVLPEHLTAPHFLARAAAAAGRLNRLVPEPVAIRRERCSLAEWWSLIRGRLTLIKSFEPYLYPLFFFQTGSFHALLLLLLFDGVPALALLFTSLLADVVSLGMLNRSFFKIRRFGRRLFLVPFLALSTPFIWALAYSGKAVRFEGRFWNIARDGAVTPYKQKS